MHVRELQEGIETLLREPEFDRSFSVLIDMRHVEKAPSIAELRDVAIAIRKHATARGAKRAIVTDHPVFHNLAALFTQLTLPALSRYRAFPTVAEAEAWLDSRSSGESGGRNP